MSLNTVIQHACNMTIEYASVAYILSQNEQYVLVWEEDIPAGTCPEIIAVVSCGELM